MCERERSACVWKMGPMSHVRFPTDSLGDEEVPSDDVINEDFDAARSNLKTSFLSFENIIVNYFSFPLLR